MSVTKIPTTVRRQVLDAWRDPKNQSLIICAGCRRSFVVPAVQLDHIVPEIESSPEMRVDPHNLQPLCAAKGDKNSCHRRKTRQEAEKRAKGNRPPRDVENILLGGSIAVAGAGLTYALWPGSGLEPGPWLGGLAATSIAAFSTNLVKNAWGVRAPLETISVDDLPKPDLGLDLARIKEAFCELVGSRGIVRVSASSRDEFTIYYPGTGFEDRKDDKRYDAVDQIQAKIGDRWTAEWKTKEDYVVFRRRPPLPKLIHHPGFDPKRTWNVLPIAEGVAFDLRQTSHLLIVGETNSGKTAMLRAIICAVLDSARRGQIKAILADPKRIEMVGFQGIKGVHRIVDEPIDLWNLAFMIQREMDRRFSLYKNQKIPLDSHDVWVCIFDEYKTYFDRCFDIWTSGLKDEDGNPFKRSGERVPGAIRALGDVISMARRAGIHIIIGTQSPDASLFGTSGMRQNLAGRATVGSIDGTRAQMMYGRSDVGRDIPSNLKGRATIQIGDGEPVEVQTYWVPDPADADPHYRNTAEDWATLARLGIERAAA